MKHGRSTQAGFTLMELMVTVVIVGILAAVAIPSYQNYVRRTNRADPKTFLAAVASKQEAFFADRRRYATTLTELGYPYATCYVGGSLGSECNANSGQPNYSIAIAAGATATNYTVEGTPMGSQANDGCGKFKIEANGTRSVTGSEADCW